MKFEFKIDNLADRDQVAAILIRNGYIVSQRVLEQQLYLFSAPTVSLDVEKDEPILGQVKP